MIHNRECRTPKRAASELSEWESLFSEMLFAMLAVYADETGTHGLKKGGKEPAPGVYGYIATPEYWETFRRSWSSGLAKYNAPYFHFRELNPPERKKPGNPYFGWDNARVDDFIYDMATIASEKAIPFGGYASIKRNQGEGARSYAKTYKLAFEQFFEDFDTTMHEHFKEQNDRVSFFFDENENEEWIGILNTNIKAAQNRNPRIAGWTSVKSKEERGMPCQAADLFAYRNRQTAETIYELDRYISLRLLDLIIGRNGFPVNHPANKLSTMSFDDWSGLVGTLRFEKWLIETPRRPDGKPIQQFYPIRHSKLLRKLLNL
jgi:hypothetical protein